MTLAGLSSPASCAHAGIEDAEFTSGRSIVIAADAVTVLRHYRTAPGDPFAMALHRFGLRRSTNRAGHAADVRITGGSPHRGTVKRVVSANAADRARKLSRRCGAIAKDVSKAAEIDNAVLLNIIAPSDVPTSSTRSGSRRGVDLLPVDPALGTQPLAPPLKDTAVKPPNPARPLCATCAK